MEKVHSTETQKKIAEWVHLYGDDLFSWAYHKTGNRDTAADLVQETFLSVVKNVDRFRGESSPKTWIFRILNHKIIDHYRKKSGPGQEKLLQESLAHTDGLFDVHGNWNPNSWEPVWEEESHLLDNPDFNKVMDICMKDLPGQWKYALTSKYENYKTTTEICQEMEVSTSNYWQIIHRAKLLLKKCLEKKWFVKL